MREARKLSRQFVAQITSRATPEAFHWLVQSKTRAPTGPRRTLAKPGAKRPAGTKPVQNDDHLNSALPHARQSCVA